MLKDNIISGADRTKSQLCQNVIKNGNEKVDIYGFAKGGYFSDIALCKYMP